MITVFIDGAIDSREAVAVTTYDGAGNITGIDLYEDHLSIGNADNRTITNANLSQYDNSVSGDEDIWFDVSAGNDLTVTGSGHTSAELFIKSGNTYRPDSLSSGNVTTHDLENQGTIQADGNTFTLSGDWVNAATATWTPNTSQVTFNGTTDQNITSNGDAFNNVTLNNTGAAGSDDIILVDALDINGNITITNGDLDPNTNNVNISVFGNWTMGVSGSLDEGTGTETVTFDNTAADQTITSNGEAFNNVTLNNTGAAGSDDIILADAFDVNGNLTITNGDLDPNTNNVNISVGGNWTMGASGSLDEGAGTENVTFDGTAADQTITSNGEAFNNVTLNNTAAAGSDDIILADALDVNGNITITNGDLDPNTNTVNVSVFGNWTMGASGSLDEGTGTETVTFDNTAADQTITSDGEAFNNVTFNNTGAAGSDDIILADAFDANGNVTITDGDLDPNTNDVNMNVGGNWTMGASGSLDEGVNNETITFDGTAADQTITSNGEAFNIVVFNNTAAAGSDDLILADALVVNRNLTISDGDLDPNTNTVNITLGGNWTMGASGSLDEGAGTETVIFNSATANQLVISDSEFFNHVTLNNTAGAGSDNITIVDAFIVNGNLTITDGDLDVNTNNVDMSVEGNWTMGAAGSFDEGTQTVTFNGGANQTVTSNGEAFYSVTINNTAAPGSNNIILADALDVNGNVTITDGDLDPNTNNINITVAGNWTVGALGTFDEGTETVTFDGANDQTITSNSRPFYNLILNNTGAAGSDDITLVDTLDVNGDLTITNGDLDPNTNNININLAGNWIMGASGSLDEGTGTETVIFDSTTGDQTITSNAEAFNNITLNNTAGAGSDDITIIDSLDVNGDMTITDGDLDVNTNNIDINVGGNWTTGVIGSLDRGTQTVTFDGTADQTITSNGESFANVVLNNTGAAGSDDIILTDLMDMQGDLTITNGDLDPNSNNANISLTGNWVMGASGSLDEGTETVVFTGTTDQTITSNGEPFYNVTLLNTGALGNNDIILVDALDVNGNLAITDGNLDASTNGIDITVAVNWNMGINGLFAHGTQTVTFDGTTDQDIISNAEPFYNVTINNTGVAGSDDVVPLDALDVDGSITITDGDLDPNTSNENITVAGNWIMGASGSLDEGAGTETVTFDGSTDQSITSNAEAFNNVTFNNTGAAGDDDLIFVDAFDANGNVVITNGDLDPNTNNVNISVAGDWTMGASGSLDEGAGTETVIFDGTAADQSITTNSEAFNNFTINNTAGAGNDDVIIVDALDVNGDVTLTDGDLDINTNNIDVMVAGSWTFGASGSLDAGTQTVTFDSTTADQTITSNGQSFYHVTLNNTAGAGNDDIILADTLDVNGKDRKSTRLNSSH